MSFIQRKADYRGSVHSVALARRRQAGRRRGKWLFLAGLAVALMALAVWLFVV